MLTLSSWAKAMVAIGRNRATSTVSPVSAAVMMRLKSRSNRSRGDIVDRSGGVAAAATAGGPPAAGAGERLLQTRSATAASPSAAPPSTQGSGTPARGAAPGSRAFPQLLQNRPDAGAPHEGQNDGWLIDDARSLGDRRAVARGTHLRVPPAQALGVEPRAVRPQVAPALRGRRVTAHAVGLRMARDAALEALARRLSMPGREEPLRVMVTGVERHVHRREAGTRVAGRAELRGVVAVTAGGGALVRLHRVRGEEAGAMVPGRSARGIRHVAVEALRARVARRARPGRCGRGRGMGCREVGSMGRGAAPARGGPPRATGSGGDERLRDPRRPDVADEAALLRVAGDAAAGAVGGEVPMLLDEVRLEVALRNPRRIAASHHPGIGRQRADGGDLRRVDVAFGTEVLRVAGRA